MKDGHEFFMALALDEARQALAAGEFPVGCVLVAGGEVVAGGRRQNSAVCANELDHGEIVALRELAARRPDFDLSRVTVYSTMEPCLMCYATLLLNGIRTVVYAYEDVMGGGTGLELERLAPLYRQMDVTVIPHVGRRESLLLFREFFANPANDYWQDSFLAEYTLGQELAEVKE